MTPAPSQPLHPRYYLHNFEQLCATVVDQYGDLLVERERELLSAFDAATVDARCLFVRLASRSGPLFPLGRLSYPELDNLPAAVDEALDLGLLHEPATPVAEDLVRVLRRAELAEVAGRVMELSGRERKRDLLERLESCSEARFVNAWQEWRGPGQRLVEVAWRPQVELFQLLFFGNTYQTLTEFVLSDLGIANYYPYQLDRDHRLFRDREEIDDYLALRLLKEQYKQAVADDDVDCVQAVGRRLLDEGSGGQSAVAYRDSLRNRVARQLERYDLGEDAIELYRCSRQHPARERRARLLAARGDDAAALELCEAIAADPWCEAEVDFAHRTLVTLRRRLKRDYQPRRRDRFQEDWLLLDPGAPVELSAAAYYSRDGSRVHHVESRLLNASFGLAFWDQIFEPVPGAFINAFQSAPLDMYSPGFYRLRRRQIDLRLAELGAVDLGTELLATWDRYQGLSNRWVGWRGLSRDLLADALKQVPRAHWLACWRRLLFDPEANRNGCPDLIALQPGGGYCLIEVKGPGDQLQLNQRRWLRFFQREGIPARVAMVRWRDD